MAASAVASAVNEITAQSYVGFDCEFLTYGLLSSLLDCNLLLVSDHKANRAQALEAWFPVQRDGCW